MDEPALFEVARHGAVAEDAGHVVVAGDDPPAEQLGPVHRVLLAEAAVLLVGPRVEAGLERVEGDGGGRADQLGQTTDCSSL